MSSATILPFMAATQVCSVYGAATTPQIAEGAQPAYFSPDPSNDSSLLDIGWDYQENEAATVAAYNALFSRLDTLSLMDEPEDAVDPGAIVTARRVAARLFKKQWPVPQMRWHGGDAIVFSWNVGDSGFMLTVVDGAVGYSERRGAEIVCRTAMVDPSEDWIINNA